MSAVFDEYQIRQIHPLSKRFEKIKEIYDDNKEDESIRWDAVWLAGEIWDDVTKDFKKLIADFMVEILNKDTNGVVKHEAAFQIGLRNMREKLPDLINAIKNDPDILVQHEGIEALGLMRDYDNIPLLAQLTQDKDKSVSQTAKFVIKRLDRLQGQGQYRDGEPI